MQHIEEAGIHSGDSSCVLPAVDIPQPLLERMRDYTFKLARALKVVGLMNIQFAIPRGNGHGGGGRQSVRARSEPARLAHRAFCFEGDGRSDGKDCGAADDRPQAARIPAGVHRAPRRSRYRKLLLREVSGVPVEQVPGRRHRARPGDEVHRRSHGRGRQLRRSLRQGATGGGTEAADAGSHLHQRDRPRQARTWHRSPASLWTWDSSWWPRPAPPT